MRVAPERRATGGLDYMSLGELMELGAVQEAVDAVISERALEGRTAAAGNESVDRRRGELLLTKGERAYCNRWNQWDDKHVAQRPKPRSKGVADRMPCRAATSEKRQ